MWPPTVGSGDQWPGRLWMSCGCPGLSGRISRAVAAAESLLICYPVTWALSLAFIRPDFGSCQDSGPTGRSLKAGRGRGTAEINYRIIRQLHWPKDDGGCRRLEWAWQTMVRFNFHISRLKLL